MSRTEFSRMYDDDPRRSWNPMLSLRFHIQPWQMLDLTPVELEAYMTALKTAGEEPTPLG